jgi:hypothetical protein
MRSVPPFQGGFPVSEKVFETVLPSYMNITKYLNPSASFTNLAGYTLVDAGFNLIKKSQASEH